MIQKLYIYLIINILTIVIAHAQLSNTSGFKKYLEQGINRFSEGNYQKAIDNFNAALICDDTPQNNTVHSWIVLTNKCLLFQKQATAAYENEEYKTALQYFDSLLAINPNDNQVKSKYEKSYITSNSVKNMALIERGFFTMGNNSGELNEQPEHNVEISSLYIDKKEVTNYEFAIFLNIFGNKYEGNSFWIDITDEDCLIKEQNGWFSAKPGCEDFPVIEVSWYGANAYAQWLGKRLPTEAEWEFVAKNIAKNNANPIFAWHSENSQKKLQITGRYPDLHYGITDLSGNVWEWCDDWYFNNFYNFSPDLNPKVLNEGEHKVIRGGAYTSTPDFLRLSFRNYEKPSETQKNIGFRCVKAL